MCVRSAVSGFVLNKNDVNITSLVSPLRLARFLPLLLYMIFLFISEYKCAYWNNASVTLRRTEEKGPFLSYLLFVFVIVHLQMSQLRRGNI